MKYDLIVLLKEFGFVEIMVFLIFQARKTKGLKNKNMSKVWEDLQTQTKVLTAKEVLKQTQTVKCLW